MSSELAQISGNIEGSSLHEFETDGLTFEYIRCGNEGDDVLVLLHGFPQDLVTWEPIVRELSQFFRVLLIQQRGYGGGNKPQCVKMYNADHLRSDVIALLNAEGVTTCNLVGHDLGGYVAWSLAHERPDLVEKLVIISMPTLGATINNLLTPQIYKLWYVPAFQIPGFGALLTGVLGGRLGTAALIRLGLPTHVAHRYVANIRRVSTWDPGPFKWYQAYKYSLSEFSRSRFVDSPTLLIWGEDDPIVRQASMEDSTCYVKSSWLLCHIPGEGHWLPEEAPSVLVDLISRFLCGTLQESTEIYTPDGDRVGIHQRQASSSGSAP